MKNFAFKLIQLRNLKNQQRFILEEEVSVSLKELAATLNTIRHFLKQNDKTVKFPLHPLPKPKQEIGFTLSNDGHFAHYFPDIEQHYSRQIYLSFCFERNMGCWLSIKKFQSVGEQNDQTEITNLRHCKVYRFYKNRYYIASKCRSFDSNFDVDSNIFAQVLYQDRSIVEFIGDVTCPNMKCRVDKCVYLRSLEEINKSTYECKPKKTCSHVLNIPFKYRKPCVTLYGWNYCFRKKSKLDYQKAKRSPLMRQYIPQSKFPTTWAEEANYELVPKKAKILPYME